MERTMWTEFEAEHAYRRERLEKDFQRAGRPLLRWLPGIGNRRPAERPGRDL